MSERATGSFDVTMTPQPPYDTEGGVALGRVSIAKTFRGGLEGTSRAEMLSAVTAVKGSAGYVAIERVTGTLSGRSGTFVLQHSGVMTRGTANLSLSVVPDSGTGDLTALSGTMQLDTASGRHDYIFDYALG